MFFLQKSLNSALRLSNASLLKKSNFLLFNSFSTRLKVINDVSRGSSFFYYRNSSSVTEEDLMNFVFGLGNRFVFSTKFSFYLNKISNQSFYFEFSRILNESIISAWDLTLVCILEIFSGRNWRGFRPFRNINDSFFVVKHIFYKFKSRGWIIKIPLVPNFCFLSSNTFKRKTFLLDLFDKKIFLFLCKIKNGILLPALFSFLLNEFL